jgi:hypothetical protein
LPEHAEYPLSQVMPQAPPPQVALPFVGSGQPTPQLEQWLGSVWVSTHWPPQLVRPDAQVVPQAPDEHTSPALQAAPQPPQCLGFDERSTHWSPHFTKPGSQEKPHWPAEQLGLPLAGAAQVLPHAPQLAGSFCVSTHALPH